MDPVSFSVTATAALTALHPYLPVIATKTAEKLGSELPAAVGKLWSAIRTRFDAKEAAKEALADLLSKPDNPAFQTSFKLQMEKLLGQDADFARRISELLPPEQPSISYQASVDGDGTVVQGSHNKVVGAGGIMVGGDVNGDIIIGNNNTLK